MIGTGEGSLIGLSMGLLLESPVESSNTRLTGIILEMSIGNLLGSLIDYIWNIT